MCVCPKVPGPHHCADNSPTAVPHPTPPTQTGSPCLKSELRGSALNRHQVRGHGVCPGPCSLSREELCSPLPSPWAPTHRQSVTAGGERREGREYEREESQRPALPDNSAGGAGSPLQVTMNGWLISWAARPNS